MRVKILNIVGSKISLSIKDVDQDTGEDLNPERLRAATGANAIALGRNPERPSHSLGWPFSDAHMCHFILNFNQD